MGNPSDPTTGGGVSTAQISGASNIVVSQEEGRLEKILVTTTLAASWTFYDSHLQTPTALATIVGYVASGAAAGTVIDLKMPVKFGITAVPSASAAGALTVSYS